MAATKHRWHSWEQMKIQEFDRLYTQLYQELYLIGFHKFDIHAPMSYQRLSPRLSLIGIEGRFNFVSMPPANKVLMFIPLVKGLMFNSRCLDIGQLGMGNIDTPCLIQHNNSGVLSFLVCELAASHTVNLFASTSMPIALELPLDQAVVDPDFFCSSLLHQLVDVSPPLRPQNLKGRSRVPRKSFVRDFVVNICESLDSQAALEKVCQQYGISDRTARDGFKETVGMTPKQFMLLEQLFQYRQCLFQQPNSCVLDIAQQLKISTPGRVAKHYVEWFGERPYQTLARSRRAEENGQP